MREIGLTNIIGQESQAILIIVFESLVFLTVSKPEVTAPIAEIPFYVSVDLVTFLPPLVLWRFCLIFDMISAAEAEND